MISAAVSKRAANRRADHRRQTQLPVNVRPRSVVCRRVGSETLDITPTYGVTALNSPLPFSLVLDASKVLDQQFAGVLL